MNYLDQSVCDQGYPRMDFEAFYQQGARCFEWRLPRDLVKQAFKKVCQTWKERHRSVDTWQIRAFIHGCHGGGGRTIRAPDHYDWPMPPDPAWDLLICVYDNHTCEIDFVHPISRRFWSEESSALSLPCDNPGIMGADWFERMGFETMRMTPLMRVTVEDPKPHLNVVKNSE